MRLLLLYYTGTYNTRYITQKLQNQLVSSFQVDCLEVDKQTPKKIDLMNYDVIGIGYPIYAFNMPQFFWKYLKKQDFPNHATYFIYKNSGETYAANDTSSLRFIRLLKKKHILVQNEYHFMMPYNIHFRFDENLVHEMITMNEKLCAILHYDLLHHVMHQNKFLMRYRLLTRILRIQSFGGKLNSFFYRVDKKKCVQCQLCVQKCPVQNITCKKGKLVFHHQCLMCMRCSMYCPTNAIHIGFLEGWKVNQPYDFKKIEKQSSEKPYITKDTKGFFRCYVKTYDAIEKRYHEIKDEI